MKEKVRLGHLLDLMIGLIVLGKEKVTPIVEELVKKGKLEKQQADKFLQQIIEKSGEGKEELEKTFTAIVKKIVSKLDLVTRGELDRIEKEITELKKKISK